MASRLHIRQIRHPQAYPFPGIYQAFPRRVGFCLMLGLPKLVSECPHHGMPLQAVSLAWDTPAVSDQPLLRIINCSVEVLGMERYLGPA